MTKIFSLLSFLLPFQLSLHLNKLALPVYGFSIDYLIPTIYITDLVVLGIIISWLRKTKFKITNKHIAFGVLFTTFIALNILSSSHLVASVYKWFKVIELVLLAYIIKNQKPLKVFDHFVKPLSYSIIIVSLLAIWQFFNQGSVGGIFYFVGERVMRFSDPGVTPIPYSTFSHPNSLAGFLLVFSLLAIKFRKKFRKKFFFIFSILLISTLILTSSLNVLLAVVALVIFYKLKITKKTIILFLLLISFTTPFLKTDSLINQSVVDRVKLAKASMQIFRSSPLVGVGLNNFIPNLVEVSRDFENSWQLQPVHNIFLLVLAETGILGFLYFVFFLYLLPATYPLYAAFLTGVFDHYWLTLQQNMLLMAMIIGFSFGKIKKIMKL